MKHLILFGFKSSGKTHLGQFLAQELQRPFLDTDSLVEKNYPEPLRARAIYQKIGKEKFRALESQVIHDLLPNPPSVIALGGGSVLDLGNVQHLKTLGRLIYLKTDLHTIQTRILHRDLPAFINPKNPALSLKEIFEERAPLYEAIADLIIDTNQATQTQILHTLKLYGF